MFLLDSRSLNKGGSFHNAISFQIVFRKKN